MTPADICNSGGKPLTPRLCNVQVGPCFLHDGTRGYEARDESNPMFAPGTGRTAAEAAGVFLRNYGNYYGVTLDVREMGRPDGPVA